MITKRSITFVVIFLWATIEYLTQIGPMDDMPFFFWLFWGICFLFPIFYLGDALKDFFPSTSDKPKIDWKKLPINLAIRFYVWIPLIVLGYFVLKDIKSIAALAFVIWNIKIGINFILMIHLRTHLISRYWSSKQAISSHSEKNSL